MTALRGCRLCALRFVLWTLFGALVLAAAPAAHAQSSDATLSRIDVISNDTGSTLARINFSASGTAGCTSGGTTSGPDGSPIHNCSGGTRAVSFTVANGNSNIRLEYTVNDPSDPRTVRGAFSVPAQVSPPLDAVADDQAISADFLGSDDVELSPGVARVLTTVVTAPDGTTMLTYTVTVTRAQPVSTNAGLANLELSTIAVWSADFDTTVTSYAVSVHNSISSVRVEPTPLESSAGVTVDGAAVSTGVFSDAIALVAGVPKNILVVVTAPDEMTTKTYTLTVTRVPASTNADLANVGLPVGAVLSPGFSATVTSYTVGVANSISGIIIRPGLADGTASATVDGGDVGVEIALAAGVPKNILVVVTAQDGVAMKTYTFTVTRSSLRFLSQQEDLTVLAGKAFSAPLALPAATGGGAPLTYAVSGLPGSLSFDKTTREISGAPGAAAAESVVVYTVTDATARAETQMFTINTVTFDLDLDASATVTAQDGIITARYLFGVRGASMVQGQSDSGNASAFEAELKKGVDTKALDVDGNGAVNFEDGIFIARYTLGLRGTELVERFAGKDSTVIENNIADLLP